jgi:hypothetical protein
MRRRRRTEEQEAANAADQPASEEAAAEVEATVSERATAPALNRQQLEQLRRRLRAKFH